MLRAFFEAGADTTLFDGLYIAENKEICEAYMGKYPVIFLSLKSVEGLSYEDARYHREMVSLIRGLFGMALKTNDSLQFAVLTGCLRISKESIFTGLNNFEVLSVLNVAYNESFGFTDNEVEKLLDDYTFSDHYPEVKEWYDGYHFGNTDIYCPWDVIRYCKSLCADL